MTATTSTVDSPRPGTYLITHHYEDPNGGWVTHRTGGPASLGAFADADRSHLVIDWYDHGHLHRLGGPATAGSDGDIFWDNEGLNITGLNGDRS